MSKSVFGDCFGIPAENAERCERGAGTREPYNPEEVSKKRVSTRGSTGVGLVKLQTLSPPKLATQQS